MMPGTIFCNICDFSEELVEKVDKWTAATITLLAVLIYELVGLALTKAALLKAGDIDPEKRKSARHAHVENMPKHKSQRHFRRQAIKEQIKTFIENEKGNSKKQ